LAVVEICPQHARASSARSNYQISVDKMEGHISRGCNFRTNCHPGTVSASSSLRTRILLKGEGMLGSVPNVDT
jgi:hypothetical protein